MNETNSICKQHSGFKIAIEKLEERNKEIAMEISKLWKKWDGLQKTFIGIFVGLSLNLIMIIALLVKIN